ncbi:MAG: carbohydrate binding domain-containing protein [Clostridia bacterium]|nr:carbohydrate binding domain-containing protein [Clostridia bacterium]
MKKVSVILAVLLALTMLPVAGVSANGVNLVANPSFTDGFDGWSYTGTAKAAISESFSHDEGGKALSFIGGTALDKWVTQDIAIEGNSDYNFSLWYWTDASSHAGKMQFYFYDTAGEMLGDKSYTENMTKTNTWTEFKVRLNSSSSSVVDDYVVTIPQGTVRVKILLNATKKGSAGKTLYFDDIYLSKVISEVTYNVEETGAITVGYNAYCPSSYEGDAPSIVGVAALYKTDGVSNTLAKVIVSPATQLIKADFAEVTLGSFEKPADNATYILKVFSLDFENAYAPYEEFPVREVFR